MKYRIDRVGDVLILAVDGHWPFPTDEDSIHKKIKEHLDKETEPHARHVIADLEHCSFMESGGIGTLVAIKATVTGRGGRVLLCAVPDRVRRSLVVSGVWLMFDTYATRGEALNAIATVVARG